MPTWHQSTQLLMTTRTPFTGNPDLEKEDSSQRKDWAQDNQAPRKQ
jgi:hypothetical protein